jgi:hypothetical protein
MTTELNNTTQISGTTAELTSYVPEFGQFVYLTDTDTLKRGDGIRSVASLASISGSDPAGGYTETRYTFDMSDAASRAYLSIPYTDLGRTLTAETPDGSYSPSFASTVARARIPQQNATPGFSGASNDLTVVGTFPLADFNIARGDTVLAGVMFNASNPTTGATGGTKTFLYDEPMVRRNFITGFSWREWSYQQPMFVVPQWDYYISGWCWTGGYPSYIETPFIVDDSIVAAGNLRLMLQFNVVYEENEFFVDIHYIDFVVRKGSSA